MKIHFECLWGSCIFECMHIFVCLLNSVLNIPMLRFFGGHLTFQTITDLDLMTTLISWEYVGN